MRQNEPLVKCSRSALHINKPSVNAGCPQRRLSSALGLEEKGHGIVNPPISPFSAAPMEGLVNRGKEPPSHCLTKENGSALQVGRGKREGTAGHPAKAHFSFIFWTFFSLICLFVESGLWQHESLCGAHGLCLCSTRFSCSEAHWILVPLPDCQKSQGKLL